jgi:hypothetical protein
MIDEAKDQQLRNGFNASIRVRSRPSRRAEKALEGYSNARNFRISDHDFQTIKIQFIALGLIAKSSKNRSLRDTGTYWSLTPYGDQRLTTLRAIPAEPEQELSPEVSQDDRTPDEEE